MSECRSHTRATEPPSKPGRGHSVQSQQGQRGAAKHPALIAGALLHPKLGWAPGWHSGQPPALPTAPGHPQQQHQLHPRRVGRSPALVPRVCLPRVPSTAWLGPCPAHSVPKSHAATAQSHQQMGKGLFCSPRCDTVTLCLHSSLTQPGPTPPTWPWFHPSPTQSKQPGAQGRSSVTGAQGARCSPTSSCGWEGDPAGPCLPC